MFRLDEGLKVYLHRAPVDFRLRTAALASPLLQIRMATWRAAGDKRPQMVPTCPRSKSSLPCSTRCAAAQRVVGR